MSVIFFYQCKSDDEEIEPEVKLSGIEISESTLSILEGESFTLTAALLPEEASGTITWKSENEEVATVTDGTVTGIARGTVTITATCEDFSDACVVTVVEKETPPEEVILNETVLTLTENETFTLTATIRPIGAEGEITWTSSDESVVTVNDGEITARKAGIAVVTAACGELSTSCMITVLPETILPTEIVLDKEELFLTETETWQLTASLIPGETTGEITWSSFDESVATVLNGLVTAIQEGEAIITASCGELTATCLVTVSRKGFLSLEGTDYYVLVLDQQTFASLGDRVKLDLRINNATSTMDIWPNGESYFAVPCRGENVYGIEDNWICMAVNSSPWDGVGGGGIRQMKDFDLSAIDETYTLHCAYKSRDGGQHEICLFTQDGNEVWVSLPATADRIWHEYEIPMRTMIARGWNFPEPYVFSGEGRYSLAFRSRPTNAVLELDAVFIYKTKESRSKSQDSRR
ncbi:MAG: Ig-like domain-containing protein [Candidatus Azobacteroides sp.]|nr:Ig-like domain-containing protein [Candidatus Azobacteroides sp.]